MITSIWDITLTVSDLGRAVRFYEATLGLQKKYQFGDYAGFDCGGVEIGMKTWGELAPPRDGEPCINFLVRDINEAYKDLKEKGVVFEKEPREVQWGGIIAAFADPDGNSLQITQMDWGKYFKTCAPS
jgi:lactoylglutathione lyase